MIRKKNYLSNQSEHMKSTKLHFPHILVTNFIQTDSRLTKLKKITENNEDLYPIFRPQITTASQFVSRSV